MNRSTEWIGNQLIPKTDGVINNDSKCSKNSKQYVMTEIEYESNLLMFINS